MKKKTLFIKTNLNFLDVCFILNHPSLIMTKIKQLNDSLELHCVKILA